jgi:nucleotide-binding universal stress UspA family protein
MVATRIDIKEILCPTDFSTFSTRALRHAATLARQFGARLKVLHVRPLMAAYGSNLSYFAALSPEAEQQLRASAQEQLREFVEPLKGDPIQIDLEVLEGEPWREICAAAEALPADLLVLGTHGRGGFERFILGSVAEKVLRRATCPVLTVCHEEGRTWEAPGLVSRILCATDLSGSSAPTIDFALSMAAEKQARVTFLHVVEETPSVIASDYPLIIASSRQLTRDTVALAERQLRSALSDEARSWCEIKERVETGRPYAKILEVAAEERSDLIILGSRRVGAVQQFLFESTLQHVVRAATCPVLAVRPRPRRVLPAVQERSLVLMAQR